MPKTGRKFKYYKLSGSFSPVGLRQSPIMERGSEMPSGCPKEEYTWLHSNNYVPPFVSKVIDKLSKSWGLLWRLCAVYISISMEDRKGDTGPEMKVRKELAYADRRLGPHQVQISLKSKTTVKQNRKTMPARLSLSWEWDICGPEPRPLWKGTNCNTVTLNWLEQMVHVEDIVTEYHAKDWTGGRFSLPLRCI